MSPLALRRSGLPRCGPSLAALSQHEKTIERGAHQCVQTRVCAGEHVTFRGSLLLLQRSVCVMVARSGTMQFPWTTGEVRIPCSVSVAAHGNRERVVAVMTCHVGVCIDISQTHGHQCLNLVYVVICCARNLRVICVIETCSWCAVLTKKEVIKVT